MSTTRWIIETPCEHGKLRWHNIAEPEFSEPDEHGRIHRLNDYRCPGPARLVVDPANLPPERVERAAEAISAEHHHDGKGPCTHCYTLAERTITAFLSDPEPGDQT